MPMAIRDEEITLKLPDAMGEKHFTNQPHIGSNIEAYVHGGCKIILCS